MGIYGKSPVLHNIYIYIDIELKFVFARLIIYKWHVLFIATIKLP